MQKAADFLNYQEWKAAAAAPSAPAPAAFEMELDLPPACPYSMPCPLGPIPNQELLSFALFCFQRDSEKGKKLDFAAQAGEMDFEEYFQEIWEEIAFPRSFLRIIGALEFAGYSPLEAAAFLGEYRSKL
jgi:hypothetical protein